MILVVEVVVAAVTTFAIATVKTAMSKPMSRFDFANAIRVGAVTKCAAY